jgi:antitoxin VapB
MKPSRASLFQNGGSQAVRLPKECRFPAGEKAVLVRKVGRTVVLEPLDEWPAGFLDCLGSLEEPIERPPRLPLSKLRDPFA